MKKVCEHLYCDVIYEEEDGCHVCQMLDQIKELEKSNDELEIELEKLKERK